MKNTKALFLIILGSFLLATGFAFANDSLNSLKSNPFGDGRASSLSPDGKSLGSLDLKAAAPAPAPTPAPKPSIGKTIKEFLSDNARNIALGGIGAYIGFVLFGPVGLVLGALVFLTAGNL